ncbi:hypothetical protein C8N35_11646 [Breoghania corrubedonensis]|uniref:Uncharacterized protein n=1 Tax=Breoghania corrubedonensis TaxID=665038 RepID=A0A2T5UQ98_9HYPH|nr:hypothetical protein C8N35_11646 [Breoghania corrubedonensis]
MTTIAVLDGTLATDRRMTFSDRAGGQFALGAMAAGAGAEEAVKIAARFDTGTGETVDTPNVEKKRV